MNPIKYMLRRMCAALIDYCLFFLFFYVYLFAFAEIRHDGYLGTRNICHQFILLLSWFVLFPTLESSLGYTLGKGLLDLKVVLQNGKKPSFIRALVRHLMDPLDVIFFLLIGIVTIRKSIHPKRIGDYLAGTEVVGES